MMKVKVKSHLPSLHKNLKILLIILIFNKNSIYNGISKNKYKKRKFQHSNFSHNYNLEYYNYSFSFLEYCDIQFGILQLFFFLCMRKRKLKIEINAK